MDFRQQPVNRLTVQPGISLDQAGDGQHNRKSDGNDQNEPILKIGQKATVKGFSRHLGQNIVKPAEANHSGKTQYPDVGVGHDPVVEMGDALHIGKGHHGSLNADKKIHDGTGKDKLGADIGMDFSQFAPGRVPDVDQKRHNRNNHGDAVHDGHHLKPGRYRHLK